MRIRNFVIAVAVLALAVPAFASAQRPDGSGGGGYKVTGGGQTVPGDDGSYRGPGDTFGFNARATGEGNEAVGQFNHIDRQPSEPGDTGRGQGDHYRGVVTCLEPTGPNSAQFGGELTNKTNDEGEPVYFVVDVQDNSDQGTDVIFYREYDGDGDNPCENDDETPENPRLSRGNLKIHNGSE